MKLLCFDCLDSTNSYLKQNYQELESLTFVETKEQTLGKGRLERKWQSEKGKNLLFSILLKDSCYFEKYKEISIVSAYSVIQVLEQYGLTNIGLKWPNDVYVNDSKICGILLESVSTNQMECLIVGIGINVNQKSFSKDLIHPATSLFNELNKEIELNQFKKDIYQQLITNYQKLVDKETFYEKIVRYDYLKDTEAYALINDEKKLVKIIKINNDYSLRIIVDNNECDIHSGEISFHI